MRVKNAIITMFAVSAFPLIASALSYAPGVLEKMQKETEGFPWGNSTVIFMVDPPIQLPIFKKDPSGKKFACLEESCAFSLQDVRGAGFGDYIMVANKDGKEYRIATIAYQDKSRKNTITRISWGSDVEYKYAEVKSLVASSSFKSAMKTLIPGLNEEIVVLVQRNAEFYEKKVMPIQDGMGRVLFPYGKRYEYILAQMKSNPSSPQYYNFNVVSGWIEVLPGINYKPSNQTTCVQDIYHIKKSTTCKFADDFAKEFDVGKKWCFWDAIFSIIPH